MTTRQFCKRTDGRSIIIKKESRKEKGEADLVNARSANSLVYLLPNLVLDQRQVPRPSHAHFLGLHHDLIRCGLLKAKHIRAFPCAEPRVGIVVGHQNSDLNAEVVEYDRGTSANQELLAIFCYPTFVELLYLGLVQPTRSLGSTMTKRSRNAFPGNPSSLAVIFCNAITKWQLVLYGIASFPLERHIQKLHQGKHACFSAWICDLQVERHRSNTPPLSGLPHEIAKATPNKNFHYLFVSHHLGDLDRIPSTGHEVIE